MFVFEWHLAVWLSWIITRNETSATTRNTPKSPVSHLVSVSRYRMFALKRCACLFIVSPPFYHVNPRGEKPFCHSSLASTHSIAKPVVRNHCIYHEKVSEKKHHSVSLNYRLRMWKGWGCLLEPRETSNGQGSHDSLLYSTPPWAGWNPVTLKETQSTNMEVPQSVTPGPQGPMVPFLKEQDLPFKLLLSMLFLVFAAAYF